MHNNIFFNKKIPRDNLIKNITDFDFGYIAWHDVSLYNYGVSGQKYLQLYGLWTTNFISKQTIR